MKDSRGRCMAVGDWLRRKRRWIGMAVALLLLGVACWPRLLQVAPFQQWFLDRVTRKIHGRLVADELRVRWWSPPIATKCALTGSRWPTGPDRAIGSW